MSKAARGTKRICQSCAGKFYDLNRDPIVCPLCGATFKLQSSEEETDLAFAEDSDDLTPSPEDIAVKPADPVADDDLLEGDEVIEDELADLAPDDEVAIADDADDETFLQPDDDDDSDVAVLIDTPIAKDDEEEG